MFSKDAFMFDSKREGVLLYMSKRFVFVDYPKRHIPFLKKSSIFVVMVVSDA